MKRRNPATQLSALKKGICTSKRPIRMLTVDFFVAAETTIDAAAAAAAAAAAGAAAAAHQIRGEIEGSLSLNDATGVPKRK